MKTVKLVALAISGDTPTAIYAGDDRSAALAAVGAANESGHYDSAVFLEGLPVPRTKFTFPLTGGPADKVAEHFLPASP